MLRSRLNALAFLCGLLGTSTLFAAPASLVVHEWGTFTSFQAADGATIPGINVDDEPVPKFVHRLDGFDILRSGGYPASWAQGAPICHPDVTLRLETPVLYFYPTAALRTQDPIDVEASFPGGWLTEFYPRATATVPGFPETLSAQTRGSLKWSDLVLGTASASDFPKTTAHVWLAPRKVRATSVGTADGSEAERYLFYRGVAHLDAPLVVRQSGDKLTISVREGEQNLNALPPTWLVRVLPDGRVRYAALPTANARRGELVVTLPPENVQNSSSDLEALRRELMRNLIAQGLFEDEAHAMLETWRLSYFASEGIRLFFLLPQAWTDARLPLSISTPAEVTRVMMGRIELVSAYQRNALARLYEQPAEQFKQIPLYVLEARNPKVDELFRDWSDGTHAGLYKAVGREVPEALKLYDSLGRFRDALIAHEWHSETDPAKRQRLMEIMSSFSSCLSPLRE